MRQYRAGWPRGGGTEGDLGREGLHRGHYQDSVLFGAGRTPLHFPRRPPTCSFTCGGHTKGETTLQVALVPPDAGVDDRTECASGSLAAARLEKLLPLPPLPRQANYYLLEGSCLILPWNPSYAGWGVTCP